MNPCEECALRLFNNKHHNLNGIGSPVFGNMIVVPNVDYDAYKKGDMSFSKQVEIIKDVVSSTGEGDLLDYVHIVPFIRCNIHLGCEINDDIYRLCSKYLINEINQYNIKRILFLGESARVCLNCNPGEYLDYIMINERQICYNVNYSPLIKFTNDKLFEDFRKYLIKWYNFAIHKFSNFSNTIII